MKGPLRVVALVAAVAAVLASCGLAPTAMPALVPAAPPQMRHDTVAPALGQSRAAEQPAVPVTTGFEPAVLHKVAAPEPAILAKPALPAASVAPMKHVWQSLNNCGPASVVMILSSMGIDADQETARLALRGTSWARGMGPTPVDPWVKGQFGVRATWRNNGTSALVKTLISNGYALMVTQWLEDPWVSRISHWRVVQGYDDARSVFHVYDPLRGRVSLSYEWFDRNWQPFSYRYLVIHKPEDEALVRVIVGADWSDRAMRQRQYERAKAEALSQGTSQAWLAYGEAAYQYGLFSEAVEAIEKGLALGSATGVFTLRSSLPNALRALGRFEEADAAQGRLANITPGVTPATSSASTTFRLDPAIAAIVAEREREARADALAERRQSRAERAQ